MGSIGEKGYFRAEPLLVVKNEEVGYYTVVEGNRRLAAVKLLTNPTLTIIKKESIKELSETIKPGIKLSELPVIEYLSRNEILIYLGYKHITGPKSWDALAKARFLFETQKTLIGTDLIEQYRILAKIIGSKTSYVKNLLIGYKLYKKIEDSNFYNIRNLNETDFSFGKFYTAVSRKNIAVFIGLDLDSDKPAERIIENNLKDLTIWMFKENEQGLTRLGDSRNIRYLNEIVSKPSALKAFKEGSPLDKAILLTDEPIKIFTTSIDDAFVSLDIARDYTHKISKQEKESDDDFISKVRICENKLSDIIEISGNLKTILEKKHV
ncbi:MAG: hypothetical protein A2X61_05790 [Ignavibacteria bacterium GWB2_35_12]|nr:MAG: hypothetical protein A2X63_00625 [Ignavibacteria bacterium GWA2_35_8]OGU42263.1 MAG: hypothetical protein A2X61_05790 [Ignavibacteria bacterium GWB2_35_12]OGU93528.1 MAG: hypothetical protein A2220_13060 [Ignavibacteria bacterium RIFOXYA2_FULL_35_10]OGV22162.1 MAG: hypothetical protein A2475_05635 [Ignavibacteria bacterium RIFOXYC2_FULL_35_21]